jgi:hypothetical protein
MMPIDADLVVLAGIVMAAVSLIAIVKVCRKALCWEINFNDRLEMLLSTEDTFKVVTDDDHISDTTFEWGDDTEVLQDLATVKREFRQ